MAASTPRLRVLVAGGGVAGVECLLGLHELAGDRVDLTLLADTGRLVESAVALGEPFGGDRAQRVPLATIAADTETRVIDGWLSEVDPAAHAVMTRRGLRLTYDVLVVALGGVPALAWGRSMALEVGVPAMLEHLRRDLARRRLRRIAIALPPGPHWSLPGYELAMLLGRHRPHGDVEITLITAEQAPLAVFGQNASAAMSQALADGGVRVITATELDVVAGDPFAVVPLGGGERFDVDLVVAVPQLSGPPLRGLPADVHRFLATDAHGRVGGVDDVYAAGDCTASPTKHGGLAAQQADAVVADLAVRAGATTEPQPPSAVLRARVMTGNGDLWLRRDLRRPGDRGEVARHSLWWPPEKIAARWLAPYLEARRDAGLGLPHAPAHGRPVDPPGRRAAVPIQRDLDLLGDPPATARP